VSVELSDTKLGNSVRVISESQPYSKSVSLGIWVNVGSRDELESHWGCSHFLEHLLFKGTEKRNAEEISATIENRGGYINAYTDRDMTAYHIRVLDRDLEVAYDVLQDIIQNSVLRDPDIDNERQVVLEEIKQLEDDPASLIYELSMENTWRGSSLAHPISGTLESMKEITPDQVRGYYNEFYGNNELVVVAAGAVDHQRFVGLVEDSVHRIDAKVTQKRSTPVHRGGLNFSPKETGQVHLSISTRGLPYGHRDTPTLAILSSYLGVGGSSRLFQEVRERRGLVYAIYTHNMSLEDTGVMGVYAGTSKQNVAQVVELTLEELEKVKSGLGEAALEETKHKTVGSLILRAESNQQRMSQLGTSTLRMGKPQTVDEVVDRLMLVSNEDVARVSSELFNKESLSITALGMSERDSENLASKINH